MKLRQGQVWKHGEEFIRIVCLERLQVKYKSTINLTAKQGTHHTSTKKEFCRLLKNATLFLPAETSNPLTPVDNTASKSRAGRPA